LLYEALTGRAPYLGSSVEIMVQKDRSDPPSPREICPAAPFDLSRLCSALLARDPSMRPDGSSILTALGAKGPSSAPLLSAVNEEVFVGRSAELSLLEDTFARARETSLELVLIEGESGLGKSALAHALARRLRQSAPTLVHLEGRCHAAEQVPFKMFDGLFDDIARYLSGLPHAACSALLPADVGLLPSLFPVLQTVEQVRERAQQLRSRVGGSNIDRFSVFRAAADLFRAIARVHPLLLIVDDVHFADAESMALLRALLDAPSPAPALLSAGWNRGAHVARRA